MLDLLTIIGLALCPLVPHAAGVMPVRRTARPYRGKHRPRPALTVTQATAAEAAYARVVTAGPEFSGHTISLPCRECGRRAVPPADYVESPPIPAERSGLVPVGSGFVITAICTACSGPLISRVLDDEYAAQARARGTIDGAPLESALHAWLATL